MRNKLFNLGMLGCLIAMWLMVSPLHAETTPLVVSIQARLSHPDTGLYDGAINVTFGFFPSDLDEPLWTETHQNVIFSRGDFLVDLGEVENNLIDPVIFNSPGIRLGILIFGEDEPTFLDLKSTPYSIQSHTSEVTYGLVDKDLFTIDRLRERIGIGTRSPQTKLDVVGTVNATALVGDGSGLVNLNVASAQLVWGRNGDDVFYSSGNIGIGVLNPAASLDVKGNLFVDGDVTVNGTIVATLLKGDGSGITSINATNVITGTLPAGRLTGPYTGVTGVGIVDTGAWEATPITDPFILNNLTMDGGSIIGTNNVSGFLRTIAPLIIGVSTQNMSLFSDTWSIDESGIGVFKAIKSTELQLTGNRLEAISNNGIKFVASNNVGIFLEDGGRVAIGHTSPQNTLDVDGGILISNTEITTPGTIRWDGTHFEGHTNDNWVRLDYLGNFDGHSLDGAGGSPLDIIFVDSNGNVGIGGNVTPEEPLHTSGNVVMNGSIFGNSLTVSGAGTRFMWYPKKAALRAGHIDSNEWDDVNIGFGSVAFGENTKASETASTVFGGDRNTVTGEYSTIGGGSNNTVSGTGSVISSGRHHSISGDFSVIAGGGTSLSSGSNTITGDNGVIGGGSHNTVGGNYATIPGGKLNVASGDFSFAAGHRAKSTHNGSFVWADSQDSDWSSTAINQFLIRSSGGVGINTTSPSTALEVVGTVKATTFLGDGTLLTNVDAASLGGVFTKTAFETGSHIYVSESDGFLPTGVVDTGAILDFTIIGDDIATGGITNRAILDGAITNEKIASGAITTEKIAAGAITSEKITPGAVTTEKIATGAITSEKIQNGAIKAEDIAAGAVTEDKIEDGAITNTKIGTDAITSKNISNEAITSEKIAVGAVTNTNIANGAITSEKILAGEITTVTIEVGAINSTLIQAGAINSTHIENNSITSQNIQDGSLTFDKFEAGTLPPEFIATGSLTTDKLANGSIDSRTISADAIQEQHIEDGAVTNAKLAGTIPILKGGTGATTFTEGSLVFVNGSQAFSENNNKLHWDNTNFRLGIGTTTPLFDLHVVGDIYPESGNVIFGNNGANIHHINYRDENWLNSTGYFVLSSSPLASDPTLANSGIRAKDGIFEGQLGVGILAPVNKMGVNGNMSIGSAYAGTVTAPTDGLLVEGDVGIGLTSPAFKLDVNGTIRARGVTVGIQGEGTDKGVSGTGGLVGVYGEGTSVGVFGKGDFQGVSGKVFNTGTGIYGEVSNASNGARGVAGQLTGSINSLGALGYTSSTFTTSVYGSQSTGGSSDNWAGYFDGTLHVGDDTGFTSASPARLEVKGQGFDSSSYAMHVVKQDQSTILSVRDDGRVGINTDTPVAALDVSGTTHFGKTAGFTQQILNNNAAIDWTLGNKIRLNHSSNLTLTFTDPPRPSSLTLILHQTAVSTITLPSGSNIKWPGGIAPVLSTASGSIDIVSFYFDGSTYYGAYSSDFK
ncbi:hypothetical protein HOH87_01645 [bacterium]|jgi:hypothetical protein|nr:hypothetical protein [bacterium]